MLKLGWLYATIAQGVLGADDQGTASRNNYLVGIYYFAGWWEKMPNKWVTNGRDWRPDYPERIPMV